MRAPSVRCSVSIVGTKLASSTVVLFLQETVATMIDHYFLLYLYRLPFFHCARIRKKRIDYQVISQYTQI